MIDNIESHWLDYFQYLPSVILKITFNVFEYTAVLNESFALKRTAI